MARRTKQELEVWREQKRRDRTIKRLDDMIKSNKLPEWRNWLYAHDSKSCGLTTMWVRLPPQAQNV